MNITTWCLMGIILSLIGEIILSNHQLKECRASIGVYEHYIKVEAHG